MSSLRVKDTVKDTIKKFPHRCGLAIIIANTYETVPPEYGQQEIKLPGCAIDANKMEEAFTKLNFAPHVELNISKDRMESLAAEAAKCAYPDSYRCIAFVFSGHGGNYVRQGHDKLHGNFVFSKDMMAVSTVQLIQGFYPKNARSIATIPKLFFFDACRGQKMMETEVVPRGDTLRYPPEGNYLAAYSNQPNHVSYQLPGKGGSLWMSKLAALLPVCQQDIAGVLHEVNRLVLSRIQLFFSAHKVMQQAVLVSCLNGALVLRDLAGLAPSQNPPKHLPGANTPETHKPLNKALPTAGLTLPADPPKPPPNPPKLGLAGAPELGERLTLSDFREVRAALHIARLQWQNLGIELGISVDDLENMRDEGRDNEQRLEKMVMAWLGTQSLLPSWEKLVGALQTEVVGREDVAQDIMDRYLH